jgi:hypothetical protein
MHAPARDEIADDERRDKDIDAEERIHCPTDADLLQKSSDGRN